MEEICGENECKRGSVQIFQSGSFMRACCEFFVVFVAYIGRSNLILPAEFTFLYSCGVRVVHRYTMRYTDKDTDTSARSRSITRKFEQERVKLPDSVKAQVAKCHVVPTSVLLRYDDVNRNMKNEPAPSQFLTPVRRRQKLKIQLSLVLLCYR
jgi:hypothetical protein